MKLAEAEPASLRRLPWWSNPFLGLCVFSLPGLVLAMALSNQTYVDLWGVAKNVDASHLMVAGAAILFFGAGMGWTRAILGDPAPLSTEVASARLVSAYRVLIRIALVGYLAWAVIGLLRGVRIADLSAVLQGRPLASYNLKQIMAPVGGVTTLTQVAPVVGALVGVLVARGEARRVAASSALLFVLAALRAYFLSERLALLELVLPALVAFLLTPRTEREHRTTTALRTWFPAFYWVGASAIFLLFEFNRSWAFYRLTSNSYVDFAVDRFAGYYATSVNNGALLTDGSFGHRPPLFTLQWVVDFPLLGPQTGLGENRLPLNELLAGSANPEFNTEGALFAPAIDFGFLPSLLVWFLLGAAAMFVYRRVRARDTAWLPLYASLYVGILESGRYFYWGLGRAFVPIVAGLIVTRYLSSTAEADPPGPSNDRSPKRELRSSDF